VGLVAVNAALQTGVPNGPAVLRQGDPHLFTDALQFPEGLDERFELRPFLRRVADTRGIAQHRRIAQIRGEPVEPVFDLL